MYIWCRYFRASISDTKRLHWLNKRIAAMLLERCIGPLEGQNQKIVRGQQPETLTHTVYLRKN